MMNELGLLKAVESTLPTTEYFYEKLNAYNLSHVFLMRQLADLSETPIAALAGDAVQRPAGYYGATAFGYTDYPFLTAKDLHTGTEGASLSLMSGVV